MHGLHGLLKTTRRYRQSARRRFRHGRRRAVVRAVTGGRLYLDGAVPTLAAAAEGCGSNVAYVRAAITLLKAGDPSLLKRAMRGAIPLTETANRVRKIVSVEAAVASWAVWTSEQRAKFGRDAGVRSNLG